MLWIWLGAVIVFAIAEAATAGLVSVWFVAGAVCALLAAAFGASVGVQLALLLAVSALTLALLRPLIRRFRKTDGEPTNLDRVIGKTGRVTEAINNDLAAGAVYVDGKTWTARAEGSGAIPADTMVRVCRMEGVKLYVMPVTEEEDLKCQVCSPCQP